MLLSQTAIVKTFYNITVVWSHVDRCFKQCSETMADSKATATDNKDIGIKLLNTEPCPTQRQCILDNTMLWNKEHCLDVMAGQHSIPLNILTMLQLKHRFSLFRY